MAGGGVGTKTSDIMRFSIVVVPKKLGGKISTEGIKMENFIGNSHNFDFFGHFAQNLYSFGHFRTLPDIWTFSDMRLQ